MFSYQWALIQNKFYKKLHLKKFDIDKISYKKLYHISFKVIIEFLFKRQTVINLFQVLYCKINSHVLTGVNNAQFSFFLTAIHSFKI